MTPPRLAILLSCSTISSSQPLSATGWTGWVHTVTAVISAVLLGSTLGHLVRVPSDDCGEPCVAELAALPALADQRRGSAHWQLHQPEQAHKGARAGAGEPTAPELFPPLPAIKCAITCHATVQAGPADSRTQPGLLSSRRAAQLSCASSTGPMLHARRARSCAAAGLPGCCRGPWLACWHCRGHW